jgi:hypothetical protein
MQKTTQKGEKPIRRTGIWCPRHPEAALVRTDCGNGKINLRCPSCTDERRSSLRIIEDVK